MPGRGKGTKKKAMGMKKNNMRAQSDAKMLAKKTKKKPARRRG